MGSKTSAGQRKHPRFYVNIQVGYATRDMFVSHYVTSLSKGGVFVETEDPLPIQSEVHLKLALPESNQTIEAKGKVAWTYDIKKGTGGHVTPGMGIRFLDLSAEHRMLLEECVQKLSTNSKDRRLDRRFDVNIRVDCETKDMFVSHYVTSLSKGGVFVETEDPLPIQSEVHLKLALPESNQTIEAKGKVAWTYDIKKGTGGHVTPGMGIRFLDLSAEHRMLLEECVQKLSSSSG